MACAVTVPASVWPADWDAVDAVGVIFESLVTRPLLARVASSSGRGEASSESENESDAEIELDEANALDLYLRTLDPCVAKVSLPIEYRSHTWARSNPKGGSEVGGGEGGYHTLTSYLGPGGLSEVSGTPPFLN